MESVSDQSEPNYESLANLLEVSAKISASPSEENWNELLSICSSVSPVSLGRTAMLFISQLVVNFNGRDKEAVRILQCIFKLLQKVKITNLRNFLEIYFVIVNIAKDENSTWFNVKTLSEEFKLGLLNCITQLFKSTNKEIHYEFISKQYYPKLSLAVFCCSQIARNEKYITLKSEALNCLMLMLCVSDDLYNDEHSKEDVADVLSLMLPGITTTCVHVVRCSETQNHKPTVLALRLWSRVVATVLSREVGYPSTLRLDGCSELNSGVSESPGEPETFFNKIGAIKYDHKLVKDTDSHLLNATKYVVKCKNHQHWKVRLELASAAYTLLSKCGVNIPSSAGLLCEVLTFLSQDEDSNVADYSKNRITDISNLFNEYSNESLANIIEECFYSLLTRLPRVIRGRDITEKEHELALMCGYLDILGHKHVPAVLHSCQHLDRLLHCLTCCTTPDYSRIMVSQEIAMREVPEDWSYVKTDWRYCHYCDSKKCETLLMSLCSKLANYSDLEMLLNRLLDLFNTDTTKQNNILLLLVFLFSNGPQERFREHSSLLKHIISTLIEPSLWDEPTDKNDHQHFCLQVSLLVDLIGCIAEAAGPSTFLPLLLQCLYPVLESAGHPVPIISHAGQSSLKKLANLYEDGKVSTLIAKNVDYLSHHVMLKLRQVHRNPRILYVLSTIMMYSSLQALPSLHGIINDVLIQSRDMFQDVNVKAFLEVFYSYLICIKKWTTTSSRTKESSLKKRSPILDLLEYKAALCADDDLTEDCEPREFNGQINEDEIEKEENDAGSIQKRNEENLPEHIKLTRDIVLRCLHFLPKNDINRQILVLQIMKEASGILSSFSEDVFLPIVHKIWAPLADRFKKSADPLLLQRAFSLLTILAEQSKDFIRARTVKDVLPCLIQILKDNCENHKKHSLKAYKFTQIYKLQLLLLSGLGKLYLDLDIDYLKITPLLEAASLYLNAKQPTELREASVKLFKDIEQQHSDIVWLYLHSINTKPSEYKPPIEGLPEYKFEASPFLQGQSSREAEELFNSIL